MLRITAVLAVTFVAFWLTPLQAQTTRVVRTSDKFYGGAVYPRAGGTYWSSACDPPACDSNSCLKYSDMLGTVVATVALHPTLNACFRDWGDGRWSSYSPEPRPPLAPMPRSTVACNPQGNISYQQFCRGTGQTGGVVSAQGGYVSSWGQFGYWWLSEHLHCEPSNGNYFNSDWHPIFTGSGVDRELTSCYKDVETAPAPNFCGPLGNPIDDGSGTKLDREVDYAAATRGGLRMERRINGRVEGWTAPYDRRLLLPGSAAGALSIAGDYCEGVSNPYTHISKRVCGLQQTRYSGIASSRSNGDIAAFSNSSPHLALHGSQRQYTLVPLPPSWLLYTADNELEHYDANGLLLSVSQPDGTFVQFTYRTAQGNVYPTGAPTCAATTTAPSTSPQCATDAFGRQLSFDYSGVDLVSVRDPSGGVIRYDYGVPLPGISWTRPLVRVTYQDNKVREYLYNEAGRAPSQPTRIFLTGKKDENGIRIGSYTYDAKGRATITEGADGVGRFAINYGVLDAAGLTYVDAVPRAVHATLPNGTVLTRTYQRIGQYSKIIGASQPAGSGCGPSSSAITYDSQANVSSRTDFNNNKICYAYDLSRNLETKRVEGVTSSAVCSTALSSPPVGARLISTQWHPDWRLETRIAEPKRLTTIVYNGQGATCAPSAVLVDGKPPAVACTRTEQATTDETGASGFAATVTGTARTWRYTYTTYGRVLTATDPNNRVTSYSYHADDDPDLGKRGNVATITNAANHVIHITDYNPHGQPTRMVDPNGVVTVLTYDPRMRLTSRTVGNEATVFGYDPVGQMTSVNLPDGARLTFTYDAAHRLTAINDHKGNRIDYTLDAMGNRTAEQMKDPAGTLVQNIARVIDALNRVQQVTGSVQ